MGKNAEVAAAIPPRRGRPPKSSAGNLSKNMYLRVRPELFDALGRSAEFSHRSISEECEFRLNRSFQNEATLSEMFGSQQHRWLLIAIGNVVRLADAMSDGSADSPAQVQASVISLLEKLAEKKASAVLDDASKGGFEWQAAAEHVAALEKGMRPQKKTMAEIMDR